MYHYTRLCQFCAQRYPPAIWITLFWLTLVFICPSVSAETRNIQSLDEPVALDQTWLFKSGDNPDWAMPEFNDSDWQQISPLRSWTRQGLRSDSGIAWYRLHLVLDQNSRTMKDVASHLALHTGNVQSAYELYVNGRLLIRQGQLPPESRIYYGERAVVSIPASLIAADGKLVFAVRVWRSPDLPASWSTGMYGEPWLFGEHTRLLIDHQSSQLIPLALSLLYLMIGIYHLCIYSLNRQYTEYLCFGLACLALMVHTAANSQLGYELGLSFRLLKSLEYAAAFVSLPLWVAVIYPLLELTRHRWVNWYSWSLLGFLVPLVLFDDFAVIAYTLDIWQVWVIPGLLLGLLVISKQVLRAAPGAKLVAVGTMVPAMAALHDILLDREIIPGVEVFSYSFCAFVFAIALSMASRMTRLRGNLESAVKARTRELELANQQLEKAIRIDGLTGISNRGAIIELAERECNRFDRNGKAFAIILVDIDHFKLFNDSYGHACGDYVLMQVAQLLSAQVRKQDAVGRWGGEEFIILLPETTGANAWQIAEKLRTSIVNAGLEYKLRDSSVPMATTITLGVAAYQKDASLDECIRQADIALYQGKAAGRNRTVLYQDPSGHAAV